MFSIKRREKFNRDYLITFEYTLRKYTIQNSDVNYAVALVTI